MANPSSRPLAVRSPPAGTVSHAVGNRGQHSGPDSSGGLPLPPTQSDLTKAQLKLLPEGTFSDLTIQSNDTTWKVRRAILVPRCKFFKITCTDEYKEAKSQLITLDDDPKAAIDSMLHYLYTLTIPPLPTRKVVQQAFIIADKYDLPPLRAASKAKLIALNRDTPWPTKDEDRDGPSTNPTVNWLDAAWSWSTEYPGDTADLHSSLVEGCAQHAGSNLDDEEFQRYIWENREFGIAFMKKLEVKAKTTEDLLGQRAGLLPGGTGTGTGSGIQIVRGRR